MQRSTENVRAGKNRILRITLQRKCYGKIKTVKQDRNMVQNFMFSLRHI